MNALRTLFDKPFAAYLTSLVFGSTSLASAATTAELSVQTSLTTITQIIGIIGTLCAAGGAYFTFRIQRLKYKELLKEKELNG